MGSTHKIFESLMKTLSEEREQPARASIDNHYSMAILNAVDKLMRERVVQLKPYEIAIQDAIEGQFPDQAWWEVTDVDIFGDLFSNRDPYATAQKVIDDIKAKELVEACKGYLENLDEAEMSDEDKKDSALIKSVIDKVAKRSNAKLTPEEQAVVDKYGLLKVGNEIYATPADSDPAPYIGMNLAKDADSGVKIGTRSFWARYGDPDKVNYADMARKRRGRFDARTVATNLGRPVDMIPRNQADERRTLNARIQQPVNTMAVALRDRKYHGSELGKAATKRQQAIDRAEQQYAWDTEYHKGGLDKANATINKLLKRDEGLKEDTQAASVINKYQQWVDYDMKRYGKISNKTNSYLKKAGLEVVKDDHGDYEVIAKDVNESCGKKRMTEKLERGFKFNNAGFEWEVLDNNGDYTLVYAKDKKFHPYVVAWMLTKNRNDDGYSWGQGHYFMDRRDAEIYLDEVGYDGSLTESTKSESDAVEELLQYLNKNTDALWDVNEIYDNCVIWEAPYDDYVEVFVNVDPKNKTKTYTVGNQDKQYIKDYTSLSSLVKDLPKYGVDGSLTESTEKVKKGKWVNRGDDGETHGTFKTKKAADAQRKAMFANGYKVKNK